MDEQQVCHWCGLRGTDTHPVKKWRELDRVTTHAGYWWCVQALQAELAAERERADRAERDLQALCQVLGLTYPHERAGN